MTSSVLLDAGVGEMRLALLEDGELAEIRIERQDEESKVGNIYRGKVERVLPGMQSAFVDIGLSKNAFLYVKDIMPVKYDENGEMLANEGGNLKIENLLSAGQELTVQVIKELTGSKGPRVTTRITLPGNFSVLLPESAFIGVSKRIEDPSERKRLREIAASIKPERTGIIIRTAADHIPDESLKDDIKDLAGKWNDVVSHESRGAVPRCLYSEPDFISHAVREFLKPDIDSFVINDSAIFEKVASLVESTSPGLKAKIRLFDKPYDLFEYYHAESALREGLDRKVWLKSGAYLIFDRTEALTVIDVNSGKFTGQTSLEETALKINLEAAAAIARQVRLRDIGGIIVVDFIDMKEKEHQDQVVNALKEAVHRDRTQTMVMGMTSLGLVEMTRKKIRQPLSKYLTVDCRCCRGAGWRLSPVTVAKRLEKRIAAQMQANRSGNLEIEVHPDLFKVLTGPEKDHIDKLREKYACALSIKASPETGYEDMIIRECMP